MANYDFEPPSFSLGLDLDTQPSPVPDPSLQPAKRTSTPADINTIEVDDDDDDDADFEFRVRVPDPPRALKRLRHGHTARIAPEARNGELADDRFNVNEDIEDFSSEEDCPRGILAANSVSSSSKPSLHGRGVVTTQSGGQSKSIKGKEVASAPASMNLEKNDSDMLFPRLTVSPLRKFQLIDSDSDDPSIIEDPGNKVPRVNVSSKEKQSNSRCNLGAKGASTSNHESEDLWKDFHFKKSLRIPTPAFDEVIEEYFTNVKSTSKPENKCKGTYNETEPENKCKDTYNDNEWDKATTLPPSYYYYFHKDSRIQELVRDRLPYFSPLEVGNNQEHEQQNVSVIDYIGQFGNEDTRQKDERQNIEKSTTGSRKIVSKSRVDSTSRASCDWVNPRSYAGPQKNAGSRRVQAVGKSSPGQWFTGSDGKRVYVNKMGHQLSGQFAYRNYRKESGKGFKNSKKTGAKKKTGGNKKSFPKKE